MIVSLSQLSFDSNYSRLPHAKEEMKNGNKAKIIPLFPVEASIPTTIRVNQIPVQDNEYIPIEYHQSVRPLKPKDIDRAKNYFLNQSGMRYKNCHLNYRNYALFVFGINTGRRISDLITLRVQDIISSDGVVKDYWRIRSEKKTKKPATVFVNQAAKEAIALYLNQLSSINMSDFVFTGYRSETHLTRSGAWKIIKKCQEALNLDYNIGTHSLRKTFATESIRKNPDDIILLQKALNHSDLKITHEYICQTRDQLRSFYEKNQL